MKPDFREAKGGANLAEWVGRYTTLKRGNGPCPFCGGADRFFVAACGTWCGCRKCEWRGDVIDLVAKAENVSKGEAAGIVSGGRVAPHAGAPRAAEPAAEKPPGWDRPQWQAEAREEIEAARLALRDSDLARGYLEGRGFEAWTWERFGLGFAPAWFDAVTRRDRPAIVIPWQDGAGVVTGVKVRYCDGAEGERFGAKKGSSPILFGLQAIEGRRQLAAVEGEFNAMAVWQAWGGACDVVSVGAQSMSHATVGALGALAGRYARVLLWFDEAKNAAAAGSVVKGAALMRSPGARDANDLLRDRGAEVLRGLIKRMSGEGSDTCSMGSAPVRGSSHEETGPPPPLPRVEAPLEQPPRLTPRARHEALCSALGLQVDTPRGRGELWQVFGDRVGVVIDGRVRFFEPWKVRA